MFIFDILIYALFALIMSFLAKKSMQFSGNTSKWDRYLILYIGFFTLIAGVRWNVGSDSISYAHGFAKGISSEVRPEILWQWFVDVIYECHIHWSVGLGIAAFLQILFVVKSVKKYRFILVVLPLVLFGGRYWQDLMGGVRQMIVACGFLWASKFIYEKKIWKYLLFVLIAAQIHRSALILIPFYFIPNRFHIENRRFLLIIILLVCCIIGRTPAYQELLTYIESVSTIIGYEDYLPTVNTLLLDNKTDEALAFGPMMLSYLLIPVFIIWFGPLLKQTYSKIIPYFSLWYNLAYMYACAYFLFSNISHIFIRPTLYLSVFQLVMASLLLYELLRQVKRSKQMQLACIIFTAIIVVNTTWDIYKAADKVREFTTYKVYFMHKDQFFLFDMER